VPFPKPVPAQVIRYCYLWKSEQERGQEEGNKDRPCAVVLTAEAEEGGSVVTVLPITHTLPYDPAEAVEIPAGTKARLGLDGARSWVVLTEANRFTWPGPDLRMAKRDDPSSIVYGLLPEHVCETIRKRFIAHLKARQAELVQRTD
jgi:PemK-like, MazF-like toxin of type II toxin-antitoxin system